MVGVELLRSVGEMIGWYLHWRRLPWFALAEFGLALICIAFYESSHNPVSLISGSLCWGIGVYMAAMHYLRLGRHPQSAIERRLGLEAAERWVAGLTPAERARLNRLSGSMSLLASGGLSANEAAEAMKAFTEALSRSQSAR